MSARSQRPSNLKRDREPERDKTSTSKITTDTAPIQAKRQRKESKPSKIATPPTMSAAAPTNNVPEAVLPAYQHLLIRNPDGIAFLFSSQFSEAIQAIAKNVAAEYHISSEDAIEELRRLLAIKTFTVDEDATKISPTPLSKQRYSNYLS